MTKNSVLAILKSAHTYVSGEKISEQLGLSRAAVNTAVKKLRSDGYEIASSTNKGYFLVNIPDILAKCEFVGLLGEERANNILCLDGVDSTNRRAKALAFGGVPDGFTVIADEQTKGRGRLGRSFFSPAKKGLYMSMVMRTPFPPSKCAVVTSLTATAVSTAINKLYGIYPEIKWVNDLLINGKKVCGILSEMSLEGESGTVQNLIAGIGINVNGEPEDFPEDIRDKASSLAHETGKSVPRAALAAEIIHELDKMRKDPCSYRKKTLAMYREKCVTVGKQVIIISGDTQTEAFAEGINDDFSLRVLLPDGTKQNISSGEVSIRGAGGYGV